jgi:hypothetical protein
MTANFILGIGGTGAKCVEAFVRLAFCGLGPDSAWVGLLDQDRANGNVARATRVLADAAELHAAFRSVGANDLGPCPLLRTRLERPKAGWSWAPDGRSSISLATAIGYGGLEPAEAALADALFSAEERQLALDEGFRQRPALGAALTLQGVTPESEVWRDLLGALQSAGQGEEVRILLLASVFGGTGAAGFPTVARLLRKAIEDRNMRGRVKLGGVLMLPYFSFPGVPPGEGPAIRPDSSAFLMQARGALEHYAGLFRAESIFETLYVLGSDPLTDLGSYSDGGSLQANRPLLPELAAALAAVDFLTVRGDEGKGIVATRTGGGDVLGWDDLPDAGPRGTVRGRIAAAVRTAVAWRQQYAPALRGDAWRPHQREAWFRRHLGRTDAAVAPDVPQRAIDLLTRGSDDLLKWFVALNRGANNGPKISLVAHELLAQAWTSHDVGQISLKNVITSDEFRRLVPPTPGPSLSDVFSSLTYGEPVEDAVGIGRLIAAIHAACLGRQAEGR